MKRRAYRINAGSIDNLRVVTEEIPDPAQDEVQVEVKAVGLNFADLYTVWGMYKAAPTEDFIPGLEYSGVISKVGEGVTDWSIGDRVMGITRFGAYVDTLNIDARYVTKIPDDWDFSHGAAFLVQALTAYYGLVELARMRDGEAVLIHSAAGGVGIQANRIAKRLGAFTIGSVGNESKVQVLQQEGYDKWIVRSANFRKDLELALGDRPLKVIMECIGGPILSDGFKTMAAEGRMVVYGNASFTTHGSKPNKLKMLVKFLRRPKIDPLMLPNSNKSVMGFNLIWLYPQVEKFHRIVNALMDMELPAPIIGEQFAFDDLASAIRRLQSGQTVGKVVVTT